MAFFQGPVFFCVVCVSEAARTLDPSTPCTRRYNPLTGADMAPTVKLPPLPQPPAKHDGPSEARLMPFRMDLAYKGHTGVSGQDVLIDPTNQRGRSRSLITTNLGGQKLVAAI